MAGYSKGEIIRINSISELHDKMSYPKPKHPLISVIDASEMQVPEEAIGVKISYDLYMVSLKDKSCGVEYGRNLLDFDEGVMSFSAPKQIYTATRAIQKNEIQGWMLLFHADLIRTTHLQDRMDLYSFFNYEVYEALHLSNEEEGIIEDCIKNIQFEYEQRIDNHSQRVIVSNIELLLNYCLRFYERQFNTRSSISSDTIGQFEKSIKSYFKNNLHLEQGIPTIQYFSEKAHLSQHYFSDLVKKETGRSPKDHINEFVIDKAKSMLLNSKESISAIAYDLGFNYPHYFTRLFKSKTGKTPLEYRQLN